MYSAPEQESQIPKNVHKELFWLQSSAILLQLSVLSKNLKFEFIFLKRYWQYRNPQTAKLLESRFRKF